MDCPRCGGPIPEDEKNLCPYCFFLLSEANGSTEEEQKAEEKAEAEGAPYSLTMLPSIPTAEESKETVDFFGLGLKVKKKGLAQILSMDVKEMLTGDWRVVKRPAQVRGENLPTLSQEASEEELEDYLAWAGETLGFEVEGRFWKIEGGRVILVEPLLEDLKAEGADRLVEGLVSSESKVDKPVSILLIVPSLNQAGLFKASITKKKALHLINAISFEDLRYLLALKEGDYLSTGSIATLLFPVASLDLHVILQVIADAIQSITGG